MLFFCDLNSFYVFTGVISPYPTVTIVVTEKYKANTYLNLNSNNFNDNSIHFFFIKIINLIKENYYFLAQVSLISNILQTETQVS